MLDIHVYAAILLGLRLASVVLILFVIKKQWALFKRPIAKRAASMRKTLFLISIAILLGNIIPALIDVLTIHGSIAGRPAEVSTTSVLYSFNNSVVAILSSFFMWVLYYRQNRDT